MKQLGRVLSFTYLSQIRSKGMIISTIIMCVIIAIGMFLPTVIDAFGGKDESKPPDDTSDMIIIVDPQAHVFTDTDEIAALFTDYHWVLEEVGEEELTRRVEEGTIHSALLIRDPMTADYIHKSDLNTLSVELTRDIQTYLTEHYRYGLLLTYNISEEDAARFFDAPLVSSVNVGLKNMIGQIQSFAFILLLYMAILTSGQMVAVSVAQEKSSRAMEVLITTSRPETLMFGKVIGIGLAGLSQMLVFLLTGAASYFPNEESLGSVGMVGEILQIPVSTYIYALVFFLGGYFFYAMMFAAIGSVVSRTEDLASSQAPMTLFTIGGFIVAIYGQLFGFADTIFYKICSFFPLTSPYVMLARISGESHIPPWEIWLSIGLLYLSTLAAGIVSAKIYRIGVLIYGKRPSFKEIVTALRQT